MKILVLLVTGLSFFSAMSKENPTFDYVGIEQGLSNNAVNEIYQDRHGLMWFGTYNGLNRFDGYTFKVFRNRLNDTASLVNNWVVAIDEDRSGNIWVGTKRGACIYSPGQDRFLPVFFKPYRGQGLQKASYAINDLQSDPKGNVFIASAGLGLLVARERGRPAIQVPFAGNVSDAACHVQSVKLDAAGTPWLFIQGVGLCRYDYKRNEIRIVDSRVKKARCIQPDRWGSVWIGNEDGIFRYSIARRTTEVYSESTGFLLNNNVYGITLDREGVLWVSTDGGGLTTYAVRTGEINHIRAGNETGSLTSNAISTVFEDRENRKWIGTLRGGVNILDNRKSRFRTISHNPAVKNGLLSNFIISFCEDENGNVYVGTDGEGMSFWNRRTNSFSNYYHDPQRPSSLSNNNVARIVKDFQNEIWISTYGGGVCKFDKRSGTFQSYPCYNTETRNTDRNAWSLFEDSRHTLWVGTCTFGGLYRLNRASNSFELFDSNLRDIICLAEDKKGVLWAGDFNSLIRVDLKGRKHKSYPLNSPVRAIFEDKYGNFWIGTENAGLLLFDRATGRYRTFSEDDGLPGNAVLNILEDDENNLWISTFNGLCRLNPRTFKFKSFYESDGLQSNQFNYNAALKLRSGELLFGGIKGFNIFLPEEIKRYSRSPKILITGLRSNNIPYERDNFFEEKHSVYDLKELELPYDKAVLSVDFAALEYSAPSKISYAYFLEGWDNSWISAGKVRTINYSRLREGNYTLHIKSTNAEGIWLNNETRLSIRILPPWWRSWWAYLIYAAGIGSALYFYTFYQRRKSFLEYQVQVANLKVDQEKELNEKKLSFFTHISHEFRTPLTLIINPVKEFLNSSISQVDSRELIVVYRNARRLLSLVDQLLLFRKSDAEELKVVEFNLVSFCREVYLCFSQQARSRNIDFRFESAEEALNVYADKEKIEIALFNLISNAFKFTPNKGSIVLKIEAGEQEVFIHIIDSGCGIPPETGEKLFDKFYQVYDRESAKAGFGIGLYLVRRFMRLHHGRVNYTSCQGKGTCFTLTLLKGKDHFRSEEVLEQVGESPLFLEELVDEGEYKTDLVVADEPDDPGLDLVTEKKTLLIVDDNTEIRNYIRQLFRQGYEVYEAESGEQGLELAKKHLPDIIISDVVMKELNGVELCMKIKEDPALSHIPVILLTSSSSAEVKLQGIEGGADDYITKPFDKDILIARVVNLLKSRTNLQRYFFNEITLKSDDSKVSSEYREFLEKCILITEKHLDNPDFSIRTLADEIGISHSSLYKKVKSISGKTVNEFIRYIRLRNAAKLMANTDCNVSEAAYASGFNDIKYFRVQFTRLFELKPSDYIRKYRKNFSKNHRLNGNLLKSR